MDINSEIIIKEEPQDSLELWDEYHYNENDIMRNEEEPQTQICCPELVKTERDLPEEKNETDAHKAKINFTGIMVKIEDINLLMNKEDDLSVNVSNRENEMKIQNFEYRKMVVRKRKLGSFKENQKSDYHRKRKITSFKNTCAKKEIVNEEQKMFQSALSSSSSNSSRKENTLHSDKLPCNERKVQQIGHENNCSQIEINGSVGSQQERHKSACPQQESQESDCSQQIRLKSAPLQQEDQNGVCSQRKSQLEKRFKCSSCEYQTNNKGHLHRHSLTHLRTKLFSCSECDYSCNQKKILEKHSFKHSEMRLLMRFKWNDECEKIKWSCTECKYTTNRKDYQRRHLLSHSNGKLLKCSDCNYASNHKGHFKTHLLAHSNIKLYKCEKCDFATNWKNSLKDHMLIHSNVKKF